MPRSTVRRVALSLAGAAVLVAGGTVGFHELLHEHWHDAFYRTAVTVTLTGLDSTPAAPAPNTSRSPSPSAAWQSSATWRRRPSKQSPVR